MRAFNEGYKAFKKGQLGNPHKPNTQEHRDWEFGFNKAYFQNLERVKERESGGRGQAVHKKEEASV